MIKRGLVGAYHARVFSVNPLRATRAFQSSEDWNLDLVGAKEAWNTTLGEGARVGIIDTGIDYDHPQLVERFDALKGIDFIDDDPYDHNGHGTHVAGTVAGEHTGVAPRASLYAVRVLNEHGYGSEVGVMKGIEWCIDNGVDVMNLSLGTHLRSSAEEKLIKIAYDKGISVVCAAGNDGDTSYNYPASYFGSISVAAIDQNKKHANFSNRNEEVDLSAPGVSVYSLAPGGGGRVLSGTSMAAPHVAGACALVVSAKKGAPEQTLSSTAEKLGEKNYFGNGLIRAGEAVK